MSKCRDCPYYLRESENESAGVTWGVCALNGIPVERNLLDGCPFENFGPPDPEG